MSNANEHPQGALTEQPPSAGGFGTPTEIVEHIDCLGDLYCTLGLDRDGTQNKLGGEIISAALLSLQ